VGEWPEIQQRALKTVLDGLWDEVMSSQSPPAGIEDLVCGLCLAYRGLAPWLREWISDSRPIAIQRLAEFVLANETDLAKHKLSDPWWNPHEMREVVDWALSDNVVNHHRNTDVSALTASAAALLARLRAAPSA
jgi:hypothetical protein